MDKPERNNTITIKMNGSTQNAQLDDKQDECAVGTISIKEESMEAIEAAKEETAAADQQKDEAFDWVLPSSVAAEGKKEAKNPVDVYTYTSTKKKKFNKSEWKKFFIAAFVAVAVGLGFMYIALRTITASDVREKPVQTVVPAAEKETPMEQPRKAESLAALPSITIYAVQGGVFSSRESALKQQGILERRSLPTVLLAEQNKYYLLLFASDSLERAKAVSGLYKEKGIDSYWKEFKVGAGQKEISKEEAEVITSSISLYHELASAGTDLLLQAEKVDIEKYKTSLKNIESLKGGKEAMAFAAPLKQAIEELSAMNDATETSLAMQKPILQFAIMYNDFMQ